MGFQGFIHVDKAHWGSNEEGIAYRKPATAASPSGWYALPALLWWVERG